MNAPVLRQGHRFALAQYEGWREPIADHRGWDKHWHLAKIRIEAPDVVKEHYRQIETPAAVKAVTNNTVGDQIRARRKALGLTQMQTAEQIGSYGVCSYGQLRCLAADTGQRIWESLEATGSTGNTRGRDDRWANAFLIKHGDRFFLSNEKGDLIIAKLTPRGYEELSRAHLLKPTNPMPGRDVVWSHPAFANKRVYMRNDEEIICVDLAAVSAEE